jgi:hypothetical protein
VEAKKQAIAENTEEYRKKRKKIKFFWTRLKEETKWDKS